MSVRNGSSGGGTTQSSTVMMQPSHLSYLLCTACMCVITSGLTHSRSNSWRGRSWGTVAEVDAIEAQSTTAKGCYCVRVGGCTPDSCRRGEGGEIMKV